MRIEEIDTTDLSKVSNNELYALRLRFMQTHDNIVKGKKAIREWTLDSLIEAYSTLADELNARSLRIAAHQLDKALDVQWAGIGDISLEYPDSAMIQVKSVAKQIVDAIPDIIKMKLLVGGHVKKVLPVAIRINKKCYTIANFDSLSAIAILPALYEIHKAENMLTVDSFDWIGNDGIVYEIYNSQLLPDGVYSFADGLITKLEYISKPGLDEINTSFRFRLRDPGEFTQGSFVTVTIKKDKPRIMCVMGKLKGEDTLTKQNYIFPKEDGWTREKAQEWVEAHKSEEPYFKILQKVDAEFIVGGIVYEADTEDAHGDFASNSEIWKALKTFMINKGDVKIQHKGKPRNVPIVECYHAESDHVKGGDVIRKGSWWMSVYLGKEADIWDSVQKGELTGFSMAGLARKM